MTGGIGKWLKSEWRATAAPNAGASTNTPLLGVAVRKTLGQHREQAGHRTVQDRAGRSPGSATAQGTRRGRSQVVDVLDEGEPGADREAHERRVHQEPEAPLSQHDDDVIALSVSSVTGAT